MTETEFFIGRTGLELDDDWCPDDLPEDWYFDHYSSLFKALALGVDTDEDLDYIFGSIHDDLGDYFELVLTIEESVLNDEAQLKQLLSNLEEYRESFTLWCRVSDQPKPACLKLIENNKLCLQSEIALKSSLNQCKLLGQNLAYSDTPVMILSDLTELESISQELLTTMKDLPRVTIICSSTVGDSFNQMQSISTLINSK
ncbi:MAG: hypothetical protein NZ775_03145 [Gammaproteobacteria bacterium]|nr:hypothetical protein [Gammaproteobacteria bacterium]